MNETTTPFSSSVIAPPLLTPPRCLRGDPLRARVDRPPASSRVGARLLSATTIHKNASHDGVAGLQFLRQHCQFLGWSPASSWVGRPLCKVE